MFIIVIFILSFFMNENASYANDKKYDDFDKQFGYLNYLDKCERLSESERYYNRFFPYITKDYQIILTTKYVADKVGFLSHKLSKRDIFDNENKLMKLYVDFLSVGYLNIQEKYPLCLFIIIYRHLFSTENKKLSKTLNEIVDIFCEVKDINFKIMPLGRGILKYIENNTCYIGNNTNVIINFLDNKIIINPKAELYRLAYEKKLKNYNVDWYIEFLKKLS